MPRIQWVTMMCRNLLMSGPVAIGEAHDTNDARQVVRNLIAQGAVRRLFLEIADIEVSFLRQVTPFDHVEGPIIDGLVAGNANLTLGALLRDAAQALRQAPAPVPPHVRTLINNFTGAFRQPGLGAVIEAAVAAGVDVFLFDNYNTPNPSRDVRLRDRTMAQEFRAATADTEAGAVLLNGANHFYPNKVGPGGSPLTVLCRIPPTRTFDLSSPEQPNDGALRPTAKPFPDEVNLSKEVVIEMLSSAAFLIGGGSK